MRRAPGRGNARREDALPLAWTRHVRVLVVAFAAKAAGQQAWRALAARRGKGVEVLESMAYGGYKDVNKAWMAGVLTIDVGSMAATHSPQEITGAAARREAWEERTAIIVYDCHLPHSAAADLAWAPLYRHV